MRLGTVQLSLPWLTVVGEVADVKEGSPDGSYKPEFYQPVGQRKESKGTFALPTDLVGNTGYIVLRTSLPPDQMENSLRAVVHSIDQRLPLAQLQTMEHVVSDSESARRFNTALISSFAFAAILLAFLGIYSVIAFLVAMRGQEMAIRMALGCQRSGIRNLMLAFGAKLAVFGCTGAASRLLRSFVFGVSPFDPLVLSLSLLAIVLLALVASALPARRAAGIDPMQALHME